jgi:hypothetical protein
MLDFLWQRGGKGTGGGFGSLPVWICAILGLVSVEGQTTIVVLLVALLNWDPKSVWWKFWHGVKYTDTSSSADSADPGVLWTDSGVFISYFRIYKKKIENLKLNLHKVELKFGRERIARDYRVAFCFSNTELKQHVKIK